MNNKTIVRAGLGLLLALGAAPAFSQAAVRVKVPFNFVVPGKVLSSGEYTMTIMPHELRIEDGYRKPLTVVLANDAYGSAGQRGRIVFRCYRDRCFLAEVWAPAHDHGLEFHLSRAEAELAAARGGTLFALMGERPKP